MKEETTLKAALTVRGDSCYCPLAFSLDAYWNCLTNCHHCYLRRMNRTWGTDLRPADPEAVREQLIRGLENKHPKSPVACAIAGRKTLRFGNKTDPFQAAEVQHGVSRRLVDVLLDLNWSTVIQTKFTTLMMQTLRLASYNYGLPLVAKTFSVMPIISPGGDRDWETFERKLTTPPSDRIKDLQILIKRGFNVGVNGEPFIPGFHTAQEFEDMLKRLKAAGVPSYNVYNLHLNDLVATNLADLGLDIEKIWTMNQDQYWRPILQHLLDIGKRIGIRVGCPDFVNSGKTYHEHANTCCGLQVANPTTFNTHHWKLMKQRGIPNEEILKTTWDGIGDFEQGRRILDGTDKEMYTMADTGLL